MATVHLQSNHRKYTGDQQVLTVDGTTVGQLIDELERRYPGLGQTLTDGCSIAINGELIANGIYQQVDDETDVHFIGMISGG